VAPQASASAPRRDFVLQAQATAEICVDTAKSRPQALFFEPLMQRTTNGAAGNGLHTTIKYMRGAAGIALGTTIKYLRSAAGNGLGPTISQVPVPATHNEQRAAPRSAAAA
jgi:hypothetical protein